MPNCWWQTSGDTTRTVMLHRGTVIPYNRNPALKQVDFVLIVQHQGVRSNFRCCWSWSSEMWPTVPHWGCSSPRLHRVSVFPHIYTSPLATLDPAVKAQQWILVECSGWWVETDGGAELAGNRSWTSQRKSADECVLLGTEHLMVCLGGSQVAVCGRFIVAKWQQVKQRKTTHIYTCVERLHCVITKLKTLYLMGSNTIHNVTSIFQGRIQNIITQEAKSRGVLHNSAHGALSLLCLCQTFKTNSSITAQHRDNKPVTAGMRLKDGWILQYTSLLQLMTEERITSWHKRSLTINFLSKVIFLFSVGRTKVVRRYTATCVHPVLSHSAHQGVLFCF